LRLDTAKFRIAKSASDLEIETERLSSQLADLQAKLQELEIQGVDGGDSAKRLQIQDEILLKLACYKSFGFEVERKANGEGDFDRVIVRGSGGVQIVSLDGKFSKFFYANHFWKTL
jgi:kinetochore protein Spc24